MIEYKVIERTDLSGNKVRAFNPGDIIRHFKGNLYRIITIAHNTETKEKEVIYESLYGLRGVWARPFDMFVSKVDREKYPNSAQEYRFEIVDIEDVLKERKNVINQESR